MRIRLTGLLVNSLGSLFGYIHTSKLNHMPTVMNPSFSKVISLVPS